MLSITRRLLLLGMIIFSLNMMMVPAAPVDVDTMDMMLQKAEEAPCGGKGEYKIQMF